MGEFSYFDQLKDTKIDLTYMLNKISLDNNLDYNNRYVFSNIQPIITTIKDLFSSYDVIFEYKNNIDIITKYTVNENELPFNVSYKVYGSAEYWWVVVLFNGITDPFSNWPLTQGQIINIAKNMYENESKYKYETYVTMLHEKNEENRNIILPKKQTLKDIIWRYREIILNG